MASASLVFGILSKSRFRINANSQIPAKNVVGTPPGRFLNRDFTDSGIRSMWAQVKILF